MTHEQFLIKAQLYYYEEHPNLAESKKIFKVLKDDIKLLIVKNSLDDCCQLAEHELEWVVNNHPELLETLFQVIIENCSPEERLTKKELNILGEEWAIKYFEFIKNYYDESESAEVSSDIWHKFYEKEFIYWKAKLRDKKINQILND